MSAAFPNGAVTKKGLLVWANVKTRAGWVAAGRQVRISIGHWLPHFLTVSLEDLHPFSKLLLSSPLLRISIFIRNLFYSKYCADLCVHRERKKAKLALLI